MKIRQFVTRNARRLDRAAASIVRFVRDVAVVALGIYVVYLSERIFALAAML